MAEIPFLKNGRLINAFDKSAAAIFYKFSGAFVIDIKFSVVLIVDNDMNRAGCRFGFAISRCRINRCCSHSVSYDVAGRINRCDFGKFAMPCHIFIGSVGGGNCRIHQETFSPLHGCAFRTNLNRSDRNGFHDRDRTRVFLPAAVLCRRINCRGSDTSGENKAAFRIDRCDACVAADPVNAWIGCIGRKIGRREINGFADCHDFASGAYGDGRNLYILIYIDRTGSGFTAAVVGSGGDDGGAFCEGGNTAAAHSRHSGIAAAPRERAVGGVFGTNGCRKGNGHADVQRHDHPVQLDGIYGYGGACDCHREIIALAAAVRGGGIDICRALEFRIDVSAGSVDGSDSGIAAAPCHGFVGCI